MVPLTLSLLVLNTVFRFRNFRYLILNRLSGEIKKGEILMQENRYSFSLHTVLLSMCPFLFIGLVFGFVSGCSGKSKQAKAPHERIREKGMIAELPKSGEIVTTERALEQGSYD